jgi:hypothetical protein
MHPVDSTGYRSHALSSCDRVGSRCRRCPLSPPSPPRSREPGVVGSQIPSVSNAPRHARPKPGHLPPWSPMDHLVHRPPHPPWFGHQPECFRHIFHALRCALDHRVRALKFPAQSPCAAPWFLSIQRSTSTPRASLDSDADHWPAARNRMSSSSARRDERFAQSFRSVGTPMRGVVAESRYRCCRIGHVALTPTATPHAVVDLPPLEALRAPHVAIRCSTRLEERAERRCGTALEDL